MEGSAGGAAGGAGWAVDVGEGAPGRDADVGEGAPGGDADAGGGAPGGDADVGGGAPGGDVDAGFSPIEDGGASLIDDDDGPIPQSFSSAPLACCLGIPLGDEEAPAIVF